MTHMFKLRKTLSNIGHFFSSFFRKNIRSTEAAKKMDLIHYTNVHGDGINIMNCRSLWTDKYDNLYRCDELYDGGRDLVFESFANTDALRGYISEHQKNKILKGVLCVYADKPCVSVDGIIYPISGTKLTRHTFGYWNFNRNIAGNYSAWKEGDFVYGQVYGDWFSIYSDKEPEEYTHKNAATHE